MLRENDCIKEFKNGNMHIEYDEYTMKSAVRGKWRTLVEVLDGLDCYLVGEEFSLGNWSMGCMIYNAYSDLVYIFDLADFKKLVEGKTVILYGHKPDEEEREEIEKDFWRFS